MSLFITVNKKNNYTKLIIIKNNIMKNFYLFIIYLFYSFLYIHIQFKSRCNE